MQLNQAEVQEAVAEWLSRRGVSVEHNQVHIHLYNTVTKESIKITNVDVAINVHDVTLSKEGPYR